jgi:ribosomal biogenesis protein LAS1
MVQYVLTPWRNRAELLAVREQFYPEHYRSLSQRSGNAATGGAGLSGPRQNRGRPTTTAAEAYHDRNRQDQGREDQEREQEQEQAIRRRRAAAAVARVSMWTQRGGCPHMVESTALLTSAILSDEASIGGGGSASTSAAAATRMLLQDGMGVAAGGYAVRAAYSAAFGRFVTGLLDSHQDKQRKMSMYDVAKSVGLPATFVELRHQATHEQLPSLTRLRAAARDALEWIWEYYWRHLTAEDAPSAAASAADDEVDEEEGVGSEKDPGEGDEHDREKVLEHLVKRCLEDGEDGGQLKLDILNQFDEVEVLKALDSAVENSRDCAVLRRAVALTREALERAGGGLNDVDRMEEDKDELVKDMGKVRQEISKAWEQVRLLEGEEEKEDEEEDDEDSEAEEQEEDVEMTETRPAWVLYEEEEWVPKPIGVA